MRRLWDEVRRWVVMGLFHACLTVHAKETFEQARGMVALANGSTINDVHAEYVRRTSANRNS